MTREVAASIALSGTASIVLSGTATVLSLNGALCRLTLVSLDAGGCNGSVCTIVLDNSCPIIIMFVASLAPGDGRDCCVCNAVSESGCSVVHLSKGALADVDGLNFQVPWTIIGRRSSGHVASADCSKLALIRRRQAGRL